jgi:hypothetical protein
MDNGLPWSEGTMIVDNHNPYFGVKFADLIITNLPIFVGLWIGDMTSHDEADFVGLKYWRF